MPYSMLISKQQRKVVINGSNSIPSIKNTKKKRRKDKKFCNIWEE
jgi:hypothetical protein